jgi:creatinine amidohydrolase
VTGKQTQSKHPLPVQWEDLTSSDFAEAVRRAGGVCVLPIGVIEKHGAHLPLSADLLAAREVSVRATQREYAVVFPPYYFGQVYEARHYPGAITIEPDLLTPLLQSACREIARNGFDKILIVNGHGGNIHWLSFFCQAQLAERADYAVYVVFSSRLLRDEQIREQIRKRRRTDWGGHADEAESSAIMALRPDLVRIERAADEDGRPRKRLNDLVEAETGIWWYADFPEHYAGDASAADPELGELELEGSTRGLVEILRSVKRDKVTPRLQAQFFARAEAPTASPTRRGRKS